MAKFISLVATSLEPPFYNDIIKIIPNLQRFGYNPQNYGGHSFRRGATTWAGSVGLSDYDIKMLGYWSSDCFFYDILIAQRTIVL
jgi:hypothetical protein